ncbi:esterase [Knoellia sinensis KCTC 19936]|uniref:Esterase n=1 Tax=Knoellia sinensis KCTC 19936 TaxID=1385520 RepID=A0A0A0JBN6_9MICO|nr:alpha/beta hydrolase fold domain-containing protein [Knoellia sinensis]KGN34229.1 esterase [Knoellia sinensis KCTC 19936]
MSLQTDVIPAGKGLPALIVRWLCRIFVRPTLTSWPLHGPLAPVMRGIDAVFAPVPRLRGTVHDKVDAPTWRAELVRPAELSVEDAKERGAVLYFHGGAFAFCGLRSHRRVVERIALATGLPVLTVDYRQHPIGGYAEAKADAVEAWRHLVDVVGVAPDRIVIAGDSAGGMLTFTTGLAASALGERPAGLVGFSPWTDFCTKSKRAHANARKDVFIPVNRLAGIAAVLHKLPEADLTIAPVEAKDLSLLPPVLMTASADEILLVDAELMAERLAAAGVPTRLTIWPGTVHAFPVLSHITPDSKRALTTATDFITERVSAATATAAQAA